MFGKQTLLCKVVLPVRSCAAAIRPDRERAWERAWRARPAGRLAKLLGLTVTSVPFDKLPHDIESAFQIDSVTLAVSREKGRKLLLVYARIGRCKAALLSEVLALR
jgi:hypothetical protein